MRCLIAVKTKTGMLAIGQVIRSVGRALDTNVMCLGLSPNIGLFINFFKCMFYVGLGSTSCQNTIYS